MPRLSTFKPEKGNDYKFFDRNIKELFQVGGTDIYIHKYMGPHDQGETNDATQPKRAVIDQMSIQDLLLLENRDRKYESDVYYARGIYNVADVDFDLTQFGLFMQNDQPFITFHQRDIIERLGRRWVHQEDDVKMTMTNTDQRSTSKLSFVNNDTVTTNQDGTTQNEKSALSRALIDKERKTPAQDKETNS